MQSNPPPACRRAPRLLGGLVVMAALGLLPGAPCPEPRGLGLLLPAAHAAQVRSALVLRWEAIPGAVAYLFEIAEDREFKRGVVRERVDAPYFRWNVIARRDYFWRVRAIDVHGREGAVSEVSRIGSEVSPPRLQAPEARARLEVSPDSPVWLRWAGSEVLAAYRVEVSADPTFRRDVRSFEVEEPRLALPTLASGEYHWRVTGVDLHGQTTEPSQARSLVLLPAEDTEVEADTPIVFSLRGPAAPELRSPAAGEVVTATAVPQPVQLSWSERAVARYQVEWWAEDGARTSATVTSAGFVLPARAAGRYTWRVRGREPNTSWSPEGSFLVAAPQPTLQAPADGTELVAGTPIVFSWGGVPLAAGYEVVLEPEEGGEARVLPASGSALELGTTAPGRYRWTVRTAGTPGTDAPARRLLTVLPSTPQASAASPQGAPSTPGASPPRTLGLAAVGGFSTNSGAAFAPGVSLEASWHAPQSQGRLGAAVRASVFGARQELRLPGQPSVDVQLWSVPVELLGQVKVPLPVVELVVSAGPLARVLAGSVALGDGARMERTALQLGGVGRVALEVRAGPGRLTGEVGLSLTSVTSDLLRTSSATLTCGAGYRLEVW